MATTKPIILIVILGVCLFHLTRALTQDEIAKFQSSGAVEQNTDLTGTITATVVGNQIQLKGNNIPDHDTGTFPANFNPNAIAAQNVDISVLLNPTSSDTPGCLSMGPIAYSYNGIPIYNLLTAEDTNALVTETFDSCNGHPDVRGTYHYHQNPVCLVDGVTENQFIGVALDGFPVYGNCTKNGTTVTNTELDECHGIEIGSAYRYCITLDFPYTLGCYRGGAITLNRPGGTCAFYKKDGTVIDEAGNLILGADSGAGVHDCVLVSLVVGVIVLLVGL